VGIYYSDYAVPGDLALRVGTAVYSIMYGVLNYFCAAELGKLVGAAIAAGTGAAAGGMVKLYKRRGQQLESSTAE
jgi:hypothetical protein